MTWNISFFIFCTYNTNSQIKTETSTIKSILCDNSDAYLLVSRNITVAAQARDSSNNVHKEVVFRNCT